MEGKARQDGWRKNISVDFDKLWGGERVGFGVIRSGETGDKESKVGGVVVLHTEVIHHQDKSDWAGGVTEKTWGKGLVEVKTLEERQDEDWTVYRLL